MSIEELVLWVADLLGQYKYLAMFAILFLCGVGLLIPEEVTLIASGLAITWYDADFFIASAVCVSAILLGDSVIFFLGRHYGRAFLNSRPMRWILNRRTQRKVDKLFSKHGYKAVFFARFFAGVRIGVYAYAGKHGMSWPRFLFLDLLGALLSGPTSIALGWYVSSRWAENKSEAIHKAVEFVDRFKIWIFAFLALLLAFFVVRHYVGRRRSSAPVESTAQPEQEPVVEPTNPSERSK